MKSVSISNCVLRYRKNQDKKKISCANSNKNASKPSCLKQGRRIFRDKMGLFEIKLNYFDYLLGELTFKVAFLLGNDHSKIYWVCEIQCNSVFQSNLGYIITSKKPSRKIEIIGFFL
jgi:hypothetical protein